MTRGSIRTGSVSACTLAAMLAAAPAAARDGDVVVTGRRVAGSAIGDTAPIAVLDPQAIGSFGATTMRDLVTKLKPLSSGVGGDAVTLLNGRRVSSMDEVYVLPPEAMERVEILSEQDAARFGYPPTVRVTNFVTKKHFRSTSVLAVPSLSTDGGGSANYSEVGMTRIEGARRTALTASHFRQNALLQSRRPIRPDSGGLYAAGGTIAGLDGGSIDPALDGLAGRPVTVAALPGDPAARRDLAAYLVGADRPSATDLGPYRTLLPQTDTVRVEGTAASPIGRALSGSLTVSMEAARTSGLNGLAPARLVVPAGAGTLPFGRDVALYRYLPDAVLRQRGSTLTLHGGGTLQGSLTRRWAWNATATYDRVRSAAAADRGVALDGLQAAIDAGADPLTPLSDAGSAGRIVDRSRTVTGTFVGKAVANGPLLRLPAGEALVTVTADAARSTSRGRQQAIDSTGFAFARTLGGVGVNAELPVAAANLGVLPFLGRLSVNGRVGVTDVSGFGSLVSSGYGFAWTPARPVQLVLSLDDARTPPAIALLTGATLAQPNVPFFDFTTGTTAVVTTLTGGNAALAPERRRALTLGLAVTPLKDKDWRLRLDYVDTSIGNQSAALGSVTPAFQSAFPDLFARDAAGVLTRVDLRPVSLYRERERRLRLTASLFAPLGPAPPNPAAPATGTPAATPSPPPPPPKPRPTLFVNIDASYRLDDRLTLRPGTPALDLLDGATLTGTGGRPRWEVEGTVSGSVGAFDLGVFGRLQGPTRIRSDIAAADLRFSGRTWLVLYGRLDAQKALSAPWARGLSLFAAAENLLNDRIAVRDRTGATPDRFQQAYLDPLGRSVRIGARKLF